MRLLIVESPTKADALARMLGPNYRVRATRGHIVDLPDDALGVDVKESFEATWKTAKGQRNVLAGLRRDAAGCDRILLATDPDREGEAIAHHLADTLARTNIPTARVTLHEITPAAVRKAVARPRALDTRLVEAQHARRVVDRLVGFAVSPALQRAVSSPRSLSAGRVQTAALRLLCEREAAIADFQPNGRWDVEAAFQTESGETITAQLHRAYRQTIETDTLDEGAAWHLAETARSLPFRVRSVRTSDEMRMPPPPFTTAAMIEAAESEGLSPAEAMRAAQQLYEGVELEDDLPAGLLTYPRTDSVAMSKAAIAAARNVVTRDFGTAYLPPRPHRHTAPDSTAEAHEPLRPTDFDRAPKSVRKYLTPAQFRIYRLVWNRAVTSQLAAAEIERTSVEITDAEGQFVFRADRSRVRARGYLQFAPDLPPAPSAPVQLSKGDALQTATLAPICRPATPPPPYTEGGLVAALDARKIGRPSTFAATLDTLRDRGYATTTDGHLRPTDLGQRACAFLVRRFPTLFDLDFTARLEAQLDAIASGKATYRSTLQQFYRGDLVPALRARPTDPAVAAGRITPPPSCERCGRPMAKRSGPHGAFYGCTGYPDCRETMPFVDPATAERCPRCKRGWIVERSTKDGRSFDGCSAYPACDFARWTGPPLPPHARR